MLYISIQELEAAINYWRSQSPAKGEELRLCPEAAALAKPYALFTPTLHYDKARSHFRAKRFLQ
jgi:hypothetical protein